MSSSIQVFHSPDLDDYFMFWALKEEKVSLPDVRFSFETADTAALNRIASEGTADIVAVSAAHYLKIADTYAVLNSGASIGHNYGPKVVAKSKLTIAELNSLRIGIPGETTTAASLLRLIAPDAKTIEIPISPFSKIFDALEQNQIDAALVIHEGQLLYEQYGLVKIVDVGEWWHEKTNLPIPLGINVIKRDLGNELIESCARVIEDSISLALKNKTEVIADLKDSVIARGVVFDDPENHSKYLEMYANEDSLGMDEKCREAFEYLLRKLSGNTSLEFNYF